MVRKRVLMLSVIALAIPLNASALGLGDINVHSALNQSFSAEIELLAVRPDEIESITVTLASSNAFAQAGLDRPTILTQLRFQVEKKANGKPYLHVYTQEPIQEPFLNYLVEVNWASGHLLREYTVLLDPPSVLVAEPPTVQAPIANSNNTGSPQRLSAGLFDSSPVQQPTPSESETGEPTSTQAPARRASPPVAQVRTTADGSSYGPTQRGEGLWSIAKSLLPNAGTADINQLMLALLEANPEAFLDTNVNTLKSGYTLRVPQPGDVTALTPQEALSLVNQQTARWKEPGYNFALQTRTPPDIAAQQNSTAQPEVAPPSPDTASSNAQLKLVPATDTPAEGATPVNEQQVAAAEQQALTGEQPAQAAELENPTASEVSKELMLANESLEAKRLENEELTARLVELEAQTESMQRLLVLQNEELAALGKPMGVTQGTKAVASINLDTTASQKVRTNNTGVPVAQPENVVDKAKTMLDRGLAALREGMDVLSSNPLVQGIAALAALLLVSLLWIIGRRRRINSRVIENPELHDVRAIAPASVAVTGEEFDVTPLVDTVSDNHPQPENKFEEALADPNDRHEVQLKLLDIYHLTNSKNAFASQAEALYADLAGKEGALWDKVVVMGREVCPEHPLFGGGEPAHVQVNEYADLPVFTESNLEPATSPATQANFAETDSDMNFWETENTPTVSNSIEFESALPEDVASHTSEQISPVSEHEFSEALSSYDLVATPHELEIEAPTPEATAAELEYNEPASDHNLDYKFDFDLEKQADFLAKANAQLVMPEADQFSGLEVDSGLLGNSDEVGTKLELARAYIEMSDPEGAQSILDEVMKEGDENQRQEAQALLLKVG